MGSRLASSENFGQKNKNFPHASAQQPEAYEEEWKTARHQYTEWAYHFMPAQERR